MTKASLLLIHGAAAGAWIWDAWRRALKQFGWQANVLDLRGHGLSLPADLTTVTLEDYVADVASVTVQIQAAQRVHPFLMGWSMGGMVAMMYAAQHAEVPGLILVEPSPPIETGGKASIDTVRGFAGDIVRPEQLGLYPDDPAQSRRALFDLDEGELADLLVKSKNAVESGLAFRQGLRGVSIPQDVINCPTLVIYGDEERRKKIVSQNRALVEHLRGEGVAVPGMGHWGIVWHEAAVSEAAPAVDAWLRRQVGPFDGADTRQEGER